MLSPATRQHGITMVELLVASVLGLVILSGLVTIYTNTISSSSNVIKANKLNQELRTIMDLMVKDIRRAGYWKNAISGIGAFSTTPNPFTASNTLDSINGTTCLLYTYDLDQDGAVDPEEYFGFKLSGNIVKTSISGSTTASAGCTNNTWADLSNSDVANINTLSFTKTYKCKNLTTNSISNPCNIASVSAPGSGDIVLITREYRIQISASHTDDASVTKNLDESVKVRNDYIRKY